ncbi:hypothetical protein G4X40_14270 [Rhodococcus sp. D2-41]|uniref:Uncharacterized protein n=1 Tax=Speluncibacter jeojiensis TaxID=2710754 RepID=A0A9X4RJ15_9ACTN|nr:hypothetical protein [Rhodococcus sp. D2-41]MDG3011317.1 hypothetical protein [Rhodococcus sp. D2-41]MDG3016671.1 hypothetical protein [Corynebacteriales bacterium D3-21]
MTTVTEPRTTPPAQRRALPILVGRWVLILACLVLGFWRSTLRTIPDFNETGLLGYLVLMPLVGLPMAIGITRRRRGELPIHDREVDHIVGALALGVSLAISFWLVPRYQEEFLLLRLDLLSAVVFVFGACVLLFGTRATCRYWPAWVTYLVFTPWGYRTLVISLGGSWFAAGATSVTMVAVATAVAVGRTWKRGVIAGLVTLAVGLVLVALMDAVAPHPTSPFLRSVPAVIVAAAVCLTYLFLVARSGAAPGSAIRSPRMPTVRKIGVAVAILLAATAAQVISPLPPPVNVHIDPGPPEAAGETSLLVPPGWTQTATEAVDWAPQFFGADATLVRQMIQADQVNPEWDTKNRRRAVVVDNLRTHQPATLAVYPGEALYSTLGSRRSETIDVDLGHGVTGRLYTVVDENLFLTWTKLQFIWSRGDVIQVVNLLSVDNHDPGATFPALSPQTAAVASQALNVLLRGNAIQIDKNPHYKDRNLLTTLGRELVAEQWKAAE